ncbi:MAG: glycoside hydrolase family 31 protein [Thermomicrobiales bacterium]|nr:glycoside hydrolase family 31 protein [Thermomicrobiales bacterium]
MANSFQIRPSSDESPWAVVGSDGTKVLRAATSPVSPFGAFAVRRDGIWQALGAPERVEDRSGGTRWQWTNPAVEVAFDSHETATLRIRLHCAGADAVMLCWVTDPDEHFYGLGERFDSLDQRGKLIELWVKNGASGLNTYKPVPWIASSKPYGIAIDTTRRIYVSLAHPTTPEVASVVVEGPKAELLVFTGDDPAAVLERYTAWVGRPPAPPAWFFRHWKSRDWRVEHQITALDDLDKHIEHGLPLGAKLIDARWEEEDHNFRFDTGRYPNPEEMICRLQDAGTELVLWISPNMTAGSAVYDECARAGFLITNDAGEPYLHRLGNQPGWEGTCFDFSNPAAVDWWQGKVRGLMEMGVRGLKTDFGEQVPEDAHFHNGKTGAEMHNLLPVLYNRATWEVVNEYGGVLLARSAWAGSQRYPGIWAGDQSPDFSPWAGLPTAIVAGQSAGWSGFPYWGSDVGGYFNAPDDEVFTRWAQFSAVCPLMEPHGLGKREAWEFSSQTLEIYRKMAYFHDALVPYSLMAAEEARMTGMPLMRAMALLYPETPDAHLDWVQYQYCYGPDLLAAPVYSWGDSRLMWFPPGEWIDFETGEMVEGPCQRRVPAPIEKLPLYVRAGSAIVLANTTHDAYEIRFFPGSSPAIRDLRLADGTEIHTEVGDGGGEVQIAGATRPVEVVFPHHPEFTVEPHSDSQFHVRRLAG